MGHSDRKATKLELSGTSTEELASLSRYLPHLSASGMREDDWDAVFIEERAEVLLRLAYARLKDWLGVDWEEGSDASAVDLNQRNTDDEEDDLGESDEGSVSTG